MTLREIQAPARARNLARGVLAVAKSLMAVGADAALEAMRHALEAEALGRLVAQAQLHEALERIQLLEEQADRDRMALLGASVRLARRAS